MFQVAILKRYADLLHGRAVKLSAVKRDVRGSTMPHVYVTLPFKNEESEHILANVVKKGTKLNSEPYC